MTIDLRNIPTPTEMYLYAQGTANYIKLHLGKGNFTPWREQQEKELVKYNEQEVLLEKEMQSSEAMKMPQWLIYIPIINFATLFNLESKEKIHIKNGL